ncbi:MAG: DNA topoisomerase III [Verrucomicrobiae bacterium]|nr:DNA topoisomerase III [Verrucomicrobiae bacterium]
MGKTLIIAEKPSVATDLARVLGGQPAVGKFMKEKDFFENDGYIISSAIGHLVEQRLPTTPDGKTLPWKFDCLPVIPEKFELEPIEGNKARLNLLKRLMKRKDVTEIINACDAGREGELIFRYIMQISGVTKPTRRLWMQSMTNQSIIDAFQHLRTDEEMQPLAAAAVCRSESDWLVGINSTRAMTAYNSRYGGFNKTPVGRVQTPTLAVLVEREMEIERFVSRPYYEVHADFGVSAGNYAGRWLDESFKKSEDESHGRPERLWDRAQAEAIVARCEGRDAIVEEKKKPTKQTPPGLYDLTSLQREANGRFGFSARRTLQLAQRLYETHKALTYPRTDSRYLPDDYVDTTIETMKKISGESGGAVTNLPSFAGKVVKEQWVSGKNRRIFNGAKVSDHFAIIPTGQFPTKLDAEEQKIYDMVTRRFVATFFPPAEFEITTRISRIGEDAFKTDGKILVVSGWLEVYGKETQAEADEDSEGSGNSGKNLVPVGEGEKAKTEDIRIEDKETRPPARFNESTLLSAMETAGKRVDDEALREAMSERGLGTPATRSSIIEGLIADKYVSRQGRDLFVSNRGVRVIHQLGEMGIDILTSPEMTGEWEFKLKQMEQGRLGRPEFMAEIKKLTEGVVTSAKTAARDSLNREYPDFPVPCPVCGAKTLGQDEVRYKCKELDCNFSLSKVLATRAFSEEEAKQLLTTKHVGPLTDFLSRFKQPFDAAVELVEDKKSGLKASFVFQKTAEEEAEAEAILPENKLCPCPVCKKGDIYETDTSYVCSERVKGEKCKGRLSKEMCKYVIPRDQALKFFTEGKTDLIEHFISKKGRPFKAHLSCNPLGKRILNWEFPPREPAKKKTATKKASS